MDKVMGGIAEALIATGVGLFVAIPAVVAYNVFQKKITDIEDNVSSMNKRLCAVLASVGSFGDTPAPGAVEGSPGHLRGAVRESSPHFSADIQDAGAEE
jgi:biopolymer transport protein ExbB/biopolymer transport protein TolQ